MALTQADRAMIDELIAQAIGKPAQPVAAQPTAALAARPALAQRADKAPASIVAQAIAAFPGDRKSARLFIADRSVPFHTCSIEIESTLNGEPVTVAAHGFIGRYDAGTPCPSAGDCKGTIRGE